MNNLPGEKDAEIADLRVVVRDIVRELRETIYQLRANVSEAEDIVMVAAGYLQRFAERTGITDPLAAVGFGAASLSNRTGALAHRSGGAGQRGTPLTSHRGHGPVGRARRRGPPRGGRQRDRDSSSKPSPVSITASWACGNVPMQ